MKKFPSPVKDSIFFFCIISSLPASLPHQVCLPMEKSNETHIFNSVLPKANLNKLEKNVILYAKGKVDKTDKSTLDALLNVICNSKKGISFRLRFVPYYDPVSLYYNSTKLSNVTLPTPTRMSFAQLG